MNKSHFLDTVRNEILVEHKNHACEVCGFHKSEKRVMIYSKEWEDSENLYVCDNCLIEIRLNDKLEVIS
jgi:hypothetical protein